uniref:RING-type E3 ubiquitin transferase n=1 Tax=Oryza meridionalis TaxID=40149 RepID=A0A0E0EFK4_9ORYZ
MPPKRPRSAAGPSGEAPVNSLDDGCLMHIFSFLSPIPDRYNTALVCHRWRFLACHPRLWLRVERPIRNTIEPGVYPNLESAVSAARPGDTILIAAGGTHVARNIQIKKPLCIQFFFVVDATLSLRLSFAYCQIGGGELPDDTVLTCSRGSDNALEFLSTCKIANLTIRAELGCCLLHRSGRLTIEECLLQCEQNPLDYLSFPIISTAIEYDSFSSLKEQGHGVTVVRTRIEGGAKAVRTNGTLALQHVRAIYSRSSVFFWFEVGERDSISIGLSMASATYLDDAHSEVIDPPKSEEMLDITELVDDHTQHSPKPNAMVSGNVRELLECPVCLNAMYPPIHQCSNGHTLCSGCKPRVHNRCPTCRHELGNIRCLALEKVAASLELPCKYQNFGCLGIYPYYCKLKHESQCQYRPYTCPYAGSECTVAGDIQYLVSHLKDDHKVDMHNGSTFNHRYVKSNPHEVENATWMLTVFSCFGQYFCLHFEAFQLGMAPVYIAFLRFMGDDAEAKNYSYSLEVGGSGRKMTWQGVPRSIRDSHRKVRDSYDGLIIQRNMALFFSGGDKKELKLRVTGRIWKEQ